MAVAVVLWLCFNPLKWSKTWHLDHWIELAVKQKTEDFEVTFKILLSVTVPLFTLVLSVTLSPSFAFSLIWWSRRHELKFASTGHERLQLFFTSTFAELCPRRSPGTLGRWVMSISAAVFKMAEKLSGFHTWTLCIFNELSLWECISLLDYKLHTNHGRLMSAISFSIRLKLSHYSLLQGGC